MSRSVLCSPTSDVTGAILLSSPHPQHREYPFNVEHLFHSVVDDSGWGHDEENCALSGRYLSASHLTSHSVQ